METLDTNIESRAGLYAKLAAVAGAIKPVEKDGNNQQLKYRYATPGAVMEACKPLLAAHRLAIIPMLTDVVKEDTGTKTQSGAATVLTRVVMTYLIVDGDSGESLAVPWAGEGQDWSDKGVAKAETIAMRTFLINLFQIPSVDEESDPDRVQHGSQPSQQGQQWHGSQSMPHRTVAAGAPKAVVEGSVALGRAGEVVRPDEVEAWRAVGNDIQAYMSEAMQLSREEAVSLVNSLSETSVRDMDLQERRNFLDWLRIDIKDRAGALRRIDAGEALSASMQGVPVPAASTMQRGAVRNGKATRAGGDLFPEEG